MKIATVLWIDNLGQKWDSGPMAPNDYEDFKNRVKTSGGMVLEQSYREYDVPLTLNNGTVHRTVTVMDIIGTIAVLASMVVVAKILGWF